MGTTAITDRPLVTNQTFIGLVPRSSRIVADFLYYSLQAHRAKLNADATGAIQSYLSRDDFRALRLPLPEPIVQREIASFLDVETGRIDALIDKKQRLARQVERRFAHFERQMALGADAPVVPIRWYIRVSSGQAFPLEDVGAEGSMAVVGGNGLVGFSDHDRTLVSVASIAIGRVGALCGNVHLVDPPAWITDNALWLRDFRGFDRGFLAAALRASELNSRSMQTAQPLITGETVKGLRIPKPSLAEQRRIADTLDSVRAQVETVCSTLAAQIELLHEHRQALITAAVTGQLDVANAAA
jgi:type I restriction enzyme S subunit